MILKVNIAYKDEILIREVEGWDSGDIKERVKGMFLEYLQECVTAKDLSPFDFKYEWKVEDKNQLLLF